MGVEEEKEQSSTTLPGTVEKIIKPLDPLEDGEKAQIGITGAEDLYREIRVDNVLTNEKGEEVRLKENTRVEVTIAADEKDTIKKAS